MEFINFGYNWEPKEVKIDLNESRTRAHLKALIRGFGSSTENLVIDFVMEQADSIREFDSVQEAWGKLDADQKGMVSGFRSFMANPFLCDVDSPHFPQLWFRRMVANEFSRLRDQREEEQGEDSLTVSEQAGLARLAEQTIRKQLNSTDQSAVWFIDTDHD